MKKSALLSTLVFLALPAYAQNAQPIQATVFAITAQGQGDSLGTLMLMDSPKGLVITPRLSHLSPGDHGFHLHEHADCGPGEKDGKVQAGIAAGGHFDPDNTKMHMGPEGQGHKGDLPVLKVDADGTAHTTVVAPRLKLADVAGHSFVIHEGPDNYSDQPKPLGGGGARIACAALTQ